MSNRATVQPTTFLNDTEVFPNSFEKVSYGIRVYDDYGDTYNNCYDSIEEVRASLQPDVLIANLLELENEVITAIIDSAYENERGLFIGSDYYEYDEIDWSVLG